jgi:hypothetical protein
LLKVFEIVGGTEIFRHTTGGRMTLKTDNTVFTVSSYYQSGRSPQRYAINAWYANPEFRYNFGKKNNVQMGSEFISGSPNGMQSQGRSFNLLYGAGHKFNGHMDYFTSMPSHTQGFGLINLYVKSEIFLSEKHSIMIDVHLFYSMFNPVIAGLTYQKYNGFENDLSYYYKINSFSTVQAGFAWYLTNDTFRAIKNKPSANEFSIFFICDAYS